MAGVQFSTSDGSVYFVRDEILSACKLEGEELEGAQKDLAGEHDAVITDSVAYDSADLPPLEFSAIGGGEEEAKAIAPTIMCCW
jgi:hypothetical protein